MDFEIKPRSFATKTTKQAKVNIIALEKTYEGAFSKWWDENESEMKDFVFRGKVLSIQIAKARQEKCKYIRFRDFKLNINENPRLISHQDLTKTRFFTLLHRFIYNKYLQETDENKKESYNVSALAVKINFFPDCCLTPIRFLLGTGFQHQHDIVIKDKSDLRGKITFVIGCTVLDWFSGLAEMSPRKDVVSNYSSFKEYAVSKDAHSGEVLSAGARAINDKDLKFLLSKDSINAFKDALNNITFNMKRNVFTHQLSKAGLKIMSDIAAMENSEKESDLR
jgi:hypothetical protein